MLFFMSRSLSVEEKQLIIDRKIKNAKENNSKCVFYKIDESERNYLNKISENENFIIEEEKINESFWGVLFRESSYLMVGLVIAGAIASSLIKDMNPEMQVFLKDKKIIATIAIGLLFQLGLRVSSGLTHKKYVLKFQSI